MAISKKLYTYTEMSKYYAHMCKMQTNVHLFTDKFVKCFNAYSKIITNTKKIEDACKQQKKN